MEPSHSLGAMHCSWSLSLNQQALTLIGELSVAFLTTMVDKDPKAKMVCLGMKGDTQIVGPVVNLFLSHSVTFVAA
jgi:hypothetical protein